MSVRAIRWTGQNLKAMIDRFPGVTFRRSMDILYVENGKGMILDKAYPDAVVYLDTDNPQWRDHLIPSISDRYNFDKQYPEVHVG